MTFKDCVLSAMVLLVIAGNVVDNMREFL